MQPRILRRSTRAASRGSVHPQAPPGAQNVAFLVFTPHTYAGRADSLLCCTASIPDFVSIIANIQYCLWALSDWCVMENEASRAPGGQDDLEVPEDFNPLNYWNDFESQLSRKIAYDSEPAESHESGWSILDGFTPQQTTTTTDSTINTPTTSNSDWQKHKSSTSSRNGDNLAIHVDSRTPSSSQISDGRREVSILISPLNFPWTTIWI